MKREITETENGLPLILPFWLMLTIVFLIGLFYHIRWQCFDITEGINKYYIDRFDTSWDMWVWILFKSGGVFGCVAIFLIISLYLLLTRLLIISLK
jgi:hypothetical protein